MAIDNILERTIPGAEFHQNRYARLLADTVRPDVAWLDVGAGHRLHSGWKHDRPGDIVRRAGVLIGCDLVPEHLHEHPLITAGVVADVGDLPFRNGSFELVTANMVLEHLRDPAAAFAEIARVLRPGGEFAFVTPNRRNPAVWFAATFLRPRWRSAFSLAFERREARDVFPTHYRANTAASISRLAKTAGLDASVVEVFQSYPFAKRPRALVSLEANWLRLVRRWWPTFGSNIVGKLVKAPSTAAS